MLEQTVIEIGGAGDVVVANARGGLPAQIAGRIKACDLDLTGLHVHLRGYQHFGTQFIVEQARVVVGDEMGLGKTIQALAAMVHLADIEGADRFMVVAPASILANWERELERRTDFTVQLLHGNDRERTVTRWLAKGGVALTSYATLRNLPHLDLVAVDLLVADEAHYAKNPVSKRTLTPARPTNGSKPSWYH